MKQVLSITLISLLLSLLTVSESTAQHYCDSCQFSDANCSDPDYMGHWCGNPSPLCDLFQVRQMNNGDSTFDFFEETPPDVEGACTHCGSQNRPARCYWMELRNTSDSCRICKVELFSCDSFLVCETFVVDNGVKNVHYNDIGGWDPNSCPWSWGAPALTQRDIHGNIINCKHNQGDCNTFPMTLKPWSGYATDNEPDCTDSCGLTSGRKLCFNLCVVQEHHTFLRFTFKIYYTCASNPLIMQTCTHALIWRKW